MASSAGFVVEGSGRRCRPGRTVVEQLMNCRNEVRIGFDGVARGSMESLLSGCGCDLVPCQRLGWGPRHGAKPAVDQSCVQGVQPFTSTLVNHHLGSQPPGHWVAGSLGGAGWSLGNLPGVRIPPMLEAVWRSGWAPQLEELVGGYASRLVTCASLLQHMRRSSEATAMGRSGS